MTAIQQLLASLVVTVVSFGASPAAAPNTASQSQAANEPISQSESANWAGYAATTGTYTGVGASWTVPIVAAESEAADAAWVGIGGVTSRDLIQAGTQAIVEGGSTQYEAWYELLPGYQVRVPLSISAGDTVTVSINEISKGEWRIRFNNETSGKSYSTDVAYDSLYSSAEWIEERPLAVGGRFASYVPLDHFGTINFDNAYAIDDGANVGIAAAGGKAIRMTSDGGIALASPSEISGSGFSVTRAVGVADDESPAPHTISPRIRTYRGHRGHLIILSVPTGDGEDDYVIGL